MQTFIFYLFIYSWTVILLFCADSIVSDRRRNLLQSQNRSILLDLNFTITGRHVCFIAAFIILSFVSALRDHVGIDYRSYAQIYIDINRGYIDIWIGGLSPGYVLINRFLGLIDPENYVLLMTAMAMMTMWYLMKAIYKMSCDWALSLYMFICFCYYQQSLNQFRQMLAIAITTYSLYYLMRGKVKIFLLYVIFATSIHKSALIMAGMCVVYNWKINFKTLFVYAIACVVMNIGFNAIIVRLANLTSYGGYLGSHVEASFDRSTVLNTLVRITILIGCLIFSKKTIKRVPGMVTFYNSAIACTVLQTLAMQSHIFARTTTYFYTPYIILVPEVLKTITSYFDRISGRLIKLAVILLLFVYYMVYIGDPRGLEEYRMLFMH